MNELKAFGHITPKGEMKIYSRDQFMQQAREYLSGTRIEITIARIDPEFSNGWRRYYFKFIVRAIREHLCQAGDMVTTEEVDYFLREQFLYEEEYNEEHDTWSRKPHTLRKHETKVTSKMFKDYCERCIGLAAQEWGLALPMIGEGQENEV